MQSRMGDNRTTSRNSQANNMMTATPIGNAISVQNVYVMDGITFVYVHIDGPYHYDSYKALPNAIMYDGITCGKSCFDSDLGIAIFRSDKKFATVHCQ
jgi:hypothetical protein